MPKSKPNQTKSYKYKYLVLYNCVQKTKKQKQNKTSHETNMKKIEI